jgi:putative ABC transport system ATP-binding protein
MSAPGTTTAPGASIEDPTAAASTVDAVKSYGSGEAEVRALNGVTVAFDRGRFTAIMGPSGSGKSTLLHCLAGLDTFTSGDVRLGGRSLTGLGEKQLTLLRRDRMGFVFQAFNLLPTLTAAENIQLPLDLAGRPVDREWFETVVRAVGLQDRLDHTPAQLSGGQQQRVAAARALVTRPEIVFADEPTGALDSRSGADLLAFLRRAVDEFDQTIVMVTHDPVAASHADRVVFLADGRIVDELAAPTTETVLDAMKRLGS